MKIFIGADHRGVTLKAAIKEALPMYTWIDVGCHSTDRTDYPIYAQDVCNRILQEPTNTPGASARGILICGSGVGMSIAANRYKGIYAALCWNEAITTSARADDNANVLVLAANQTNPELAVKLVQLFIETSFKEGVYRQRLCMVDEE